VEVEATEAEGVAEEENTTGISMAVVVVDVGDEGLASVGAATGAMRAVTRLTGPSAVTAVAARLQTQTHRILVAR
jgi:hypothetical protein